jgi:excisionase family DNA binding protein
MRTISKSTNEIAKRGIRIPAFCSHYGVGRSTVYRLIKEGKLARLKVGRCTLIDVDDAERWWRTCVRGQV